MAGVIAMILAGGEGTRLQPLTVTRSKPAVPFAGSYRLIDFVLNNFVNSDIIRIFVLTQFKSQSLYMHMKKGWTVNGIPGCFIDPIPAQMRMGKRWYDGTADAIFQNLSFIRYNSPDQVCIFGSDHVYKMDIRQMLEYHKNKKADLTVSAIKVPIKQARSFGVIEVDSEWKMIGFEEKPKNPKPIPGEPDYALVSMGNYIFEADTLYEELAIDSVNQNSTHDFGCDVIPNIYPKRPVYVYNFLDNYIPNEKNKGYWRDVGSIDMYWQTNMDLIDEEPSFVLHNPSWPLHTNYPPLPPANFINTKNRQCSISQSMISAGSEIVGASVDHSIIGFNCRIEENAEISDSVLLGDVVVGSNCKIKKAIIDKHVTIAPGTVIGEDPEHDRSFYTVSDGGVVVIPKGARIGY
ncbi:MAG: glucose-1-phosphate adenylyltransferase [Ruminobacter sp.]|jgi:glucose-1-phosphate adenylyltransferase|uniref:glucose-1-phosphate adenylyltransferase n=1 Tax=Ruminobacter TaxID=866 RepID=UPI00258050F7|nr:glucose-1-phosphate adenylyltransferase [Ruminobacter sp.]MBQ3774670.1 glucose-1-phosphate adenylyltransferase [Ruminobacter sp.]